MAINIENTSVFHNDSTSQHQEQFDRHRGPITCVAGIPGTDLAVSCGYDSAVGIVDLKQGSIELLGYHRHLVNRIVVDESGARAASCSSDYTICIWDLEKREPLRVLRGHWDDVEDFAFIDLDTGVSVSRDRRIFIWDLRTGTIVNTFDGHEKDVLSVEYSNGMIYSSGDDMTLRQWRLATGELLKTWGPLDEETDTCAIDPIHNRVMLGSDAGIIRIFDSRTGDFICEINAHTAGIKKVAVSSVNGDILSAAYDQYVRIWDAESFELKLDLETHMATWERSLNWSPDGNTILAGTFDGTVLQWDAVSGELLAEIGDQGEYPGNACLNDVDTSPDSTFAVVSDDGFIRMGQLSATAAEWTQTIAPKTGRMLMNSICLDDTAAKVLAGSHNHNLHIFDLSNGQLCNEHTLRLNEGPINCIRLSAPMDGVRDAFVACYSGSIVRVSLDGEIKGKFKLHDGAVKSVRTHPEKALGVSGAADGSLITWDFNGQQIKRLQGHTAIVDDIDFDPSGKFVASVSRDFTVNVYDVDSGCMLHSILLGRQSPKCVLFWSQDTVIVGNYWGHLLRVRLSNQKVSSHKIAINGISALARCGKYLIAVSYDGGAYLVNPEDMTVIRFLRTMHQKLPEFRDGASFD